MLMLAGAVVVSWDNLGFAESLSASLTCIANVGPGLGALGPSGNFSVLSAFSQLVLSFLMLLGRLEILPLLVLLVPAMWKKR
jgi:trk system potassium uptake protein TrkH